MLERNYPLCFNNMSCIVFDYFDCELTSIKIKDKSFPVEYGRKRSHVGFEEAMKLENIEEEQFQNLKCDSNRPTTEVPNNMSAIRNYRRL